MLIVIPGYCKSRELEYEGEDAGTGCEGWEKGGGEC
jgi:hypothetical protein